MLGVGSGTLTRMVMHSDGSPNWFGIVLLTTTVLLIVIWRCVVFVPEYWVATRRRFNRVVMRSGMPLEYDPLVMRPIKPIKPWQFHRRLLRQLRRWRGKPEPIGKMTGTFRFRFYIFNSLVLTNCGDRETDLDIDAITLKDVDFDTRMSAEWRVSREPGNPTKSFQKPSETGWSWRRSDRDELERLVLRRISHAVLRAYEAIEETLSEAPLRLPFLDVGQHLAEVRDSLLSDYGVELDALRYGRRSVSSATRKRQGDMAIAAAVRKVAKVIKGRTPQALPDEVLPDGVPRIPAA